MILSINDIAYLTCMADALKDEGRLNERDVVIFKMRMRGESFVKIRSIMPNPISYARVRQVCWKTMCKVMRFSQSPICLSNKQLREIFKR